MYINICMIKLLLMHLTCTSIFSMFVSWERQMTWTLSVSKTEDKSCGIHRSNYWQMFVSWLDILQVHGYKWWWWWWRMPLEWTGTEYLLVQLRYNKDLTFTRVLKHFIITARLAKRAKVIFSQASVILLPKGGEVIRGQPPPPGQYHLPSV